MFYGRLLCQVPESCAGRCAGVTQIDRIVEAVEETLKVGARPELTYPSGFSALKP